MCFHSPSAPDRPDLERLGWGPFFEIQRQRLDRTDLLFARIVDEQRGACRAAGEFTGWVEVSGRFRHEAAGAADFPPTDTSVGVLETIEKDLGSAKAEYKTLMERDVPAFNRAVAGTIVPLTSPRH